MEINIIKNYLKTGILLLGISLFLFNCQEEEFFNSENVSQKSKLKVKTLTFNELKTIKSLETTLQRINKKFDINKKKPNLNKNSIISNDGSFTILTDSIIEVELDSVITYSFRIETPTISEADFENFIIKEENDNFTYYIYSYQFSENGHKEYIREISEDNINLEDFSLNKWNIIFFDGCWLVDFGTYVYCLPVVDDTDSILDGQGGESTGSSTANTSGTNGSYSNGNNGMGSSSSNNNNNPPIAGVVLSPQEIALIEIKECLNPSMNASVWLNNQAKPSNGLLGGSNLININNYLQQNDCSQDAQDFVEDAIELSENSPFDLDIIEPLPQDNSPEAVKLRCIYKKLTESPKFKSLFVDTFGESADFDIKFEIDDLPINSTTNTRQSAITSGISQTDFSTQTIVMDRTHLLSDHPLSTAQTIIHEALHAYMNLFQIDCWNNPGDQLTAEQIEALNEYTMDELLNGFNLPCNNVNNNDHRLMYNQMLAVMDEMLQEVFDDLVASEDLSANYWFTTISAQFSWNNAIHYLNLSGLQEAQEYNDDVTANPNLGLLVPAYYEYLNDSTKFNHNTCN